MDGQQARLAEFYMELNFPQTAPNSGLQTLGVDLPMDEGSASNVEVRKAVARLRSG